MHYTANLKYSFMQFSWKFSLVVVCVCARRRCQMPWQPNALASFLFLSCSLRAIPFIAVICINSHNSHFTTTLNAVYYYFQNATKSEPSQLSGAHHTPCIYATIFYAWWWRRFSSSSMSVDCVYLLHAISRATVARSEKSCLAHLWQDL